MVSGALTLLIRFSPLAARVAESVRLQMNRQSWSVEPGQIAAVLFSDKVDDDTKSRVAAKILALRPADFSFPGLGGTISLPSSTLPTTSSFSPQSNLPTPNDLTRGKPPLPTISSGKTLVDFVTPHSVLFLARFCRNATKWLEQNPPWDNIPEYRLAKCIIEGIVPVNDLAERLCTTAKRYRISNTCKQFSVLVKFRVETQLHHDPV